MSVRVLPAVVAVGFAAAVAMLLFVPYVAREHHGRGEFAGGVATVRLGVLLYALALPSYVLLPLPSEGFCADSQISPQWMISAPGDAAQFGWNILLFVPLGMFVRSPASRSLATTVLLGFGVSLGIELTQLTGTWFAFPCPYRVFDANDLLANTVGALAGGMLAPLLRLLPWQYSGMPPMSPRPVTAARRLLGMCCDGILLWLLGVVAAHAGRWTAWMPLSRSWRESVVLWFAPALAVLCATMIGRGSTLGQYAVLLRSVSPAGAPRLRATMLRWTVGLGGLAIVEGVADGLALPEAMTMGIAVTWCTVHALGATRGLAHRGISGRAAGLDVVDARTPSAGTGSRASS